MIYGCSQILENVLSKFRIQTHFYSSSFNFKAHCPRVKVHDAVIYRGNF